MIWFFVCLFVTDNLKNYLTDFKAKATLSASSMGFI